MTDKIKRTKTNVKDMWRGSQVVGKFLAEIVCGAAAAGVLGMAGTYAYKQVGPVKYLAFFAVTLMGLIALRVIGSYVKTKGTSYEH